MSRTKATLLVLLEALSDVGVCSEARKFLRRLPLETGVLKSSVPAATKLLRPKPHKLTITQKRIEGVLYYDSTVL